MRFTFVFIFLIYVLHSDDIKLRVGATPVPAAEILEYVKPILKSYGINLVVEVFADYISPDIALNDGSIDANLYQHKPFLEMIKRDRGLHLVGLLPVYITRLGFYSSKINKIKDIKKGAIIAIPNDPTNYSRALILLDNNEIIKLRDPSDLDSTEFDIVSNPNNIKFKKMDAALLPTILNSVDGAVITFNYALQAGLSIEDSIFYENDKSIYAIILVTREGNEGNSAILKLQEVLLSDDVRTFIKSTYNGIAIPIDID